MIMVTGVQTESQLQDDKDDCQIFFFFGGGAGGGAGKSVTVNIIFFILTLKVDISQEKPSLREKCLNTEFYLVRIFLYSDQKKLRIWTHFTQCFIYKI